MVHIESFETSIFVTVILLIPIYQLKYITMDKISLIIFRTDTNPKAGIVYNIECDPSFSGKKDKNNCFETNPSNNGSFLAKPNAKRNTSKL